MGPTGVEHLLQTHRETTIPVLGGAESGAESGAVTAQRHAMSPDLQSIVAACLTLAEATINAIVAILATVPNEDRQFSCHRHPVVDLASF